MDFIISFLSAISVASVVLTAMWFLVPKGAAENIFKYAMGIFMISVVVSTFGAAFSNPNFEYPAINTDSVMVKARSITAETSGYIIESLLDRCNIQFKEVDIIMDNSDSSDISITKARIEFINDEDFDIAAEIIKNQTGIVLVR